MSVSTAALVAACGATEPTSAPATLAVPDTVALGLLPEPLSDVGPPPLPPTSPSSGSTTTSTSPPSITGSVGDAAAGPRLLMIGDAVMASITPRNGGIACDVIPGLGWQVEIDAEPGRFVEFGDVVLDRRLQPGIEWDAVAIMLGNQFDGDLEQFVTQLGSILDRVTPRPTVLYTVSEVGDQPAALDDAIRQEAARRPNVVLIDWAEITAAEPDVILSQGGPEPTPEGSGRLVLFTAAALGQAPGGQPGECLPPVFVDDSAIVL